MVSYFKESLMRKLIVLFLITALIPIIIVVLFFNSSMKQALLDEKLNFLLETTEDRKMELINQIVEAGEDLSVLASTSDISNIIQMLKGINCVF